MVTVGGRRLLNLPLEGEVDCSPSAYRTRMRSRKEKSQRPSSDGKSGAEQQHSPPGLAVCSSPGVVQVHHPVSHAAAQVVPERWSTPKPTVWERLDYGVCVFQGTDEDGPDMRAIERRTTVDMHTWEIIADESAGSIADWSAPLPGQVPRDVKTILVVSTAPIVDSSSPGIVSDSSGPIVPEDSVQDEGEMEVQERKVEDDEVWLFCPPSSDDAPGVTDNSKGIKVRTALVHWNTMHQNGILFRVILDFMIILTLSVRWNPGSSISVMDIFQRRRIAASARGQTVPSKSMENVKGNICLSGSTC